MGLQAAITARIDELQGLSEEAQAQQRCEMAQSLEEVGAYEYAREVLKPLWDGPGTRPKLDGLGPELTPEVLLRVGSLTAWLGSVQQAEGSQALAESLLKEARDLFGQVNNWAKYAEAQNALSVCYWRQGKNGFYQLALEVIHDALDKLGDSNLDLKIILMVNLGGNLRALNQHDEAMEIFLKAASLMEQSHSHLVKGRVHHVLAISKSNGGDIDGSLLENTGASFHYKEAGADRWYARVENNLGYQYYKLGKNEKAQEHLERARDILIALEDHGVLAEVEETRASVFLQQKMLPEALEAADTAVGLLEKANETAFIVDALVTLGRAQARLRRKDEAMETFNRAYRHSTQISEQKASQVGVAQIEELAGYMYLGTGVKFEAAVHTFEAGLIKESLNLTNRKITPAALRLGLHHNTLLTMLHGRHHQLLPERTEIRSRKRSIMIGKKGGAKKADVAKLKVKKRG